MQSGLSRERPSVFEILHPHYGIPIKLMSSSLEFASKSCFPCTSVVESFINHAMEIGRDFDLAALEGTHSIAPQVANKIAKLQDDILASAWFGFSAYDATFVIRGQQDHSEAHVTMVLNLLDNRSPLVGLFMENDGLEAYRLKKARYCFARSLVMAVDDEDFAIWSGFWCNFRSRSGEFLVIGDLFFK